MKEIADPGRWTEGIVFVLVISFYGCAAPVQGLWPPQDGAPSHTIVISLDTWHAMIAFPLAPFSFDRDVDESVRGFQCSSTFINPLM